MVQTKKIDEKPVSKTNKYIILNPEYDHRTGRLFSEEFIDSLSDEAILSLEDRDYDSFRFFVGEEFEDLVEEIFEIYSDMSDLTEKIHPLTYTQRLKRAQVMRKYKSKMKVARERARLRRATPDVIKARARKRAIALLRTRFLKNRSYDDLAVSEKNALDLRMARLPDSLIDKIARKQIVVLRQMEADRISSAQSQQHESVEPKAKRYHQMFNKDSTVKHDMRFKRYSDAKQLMKETEDFVESTAVDLVKQRIELEKTQDLTKHKRMMDQAKEQDKRTRQIRSEESDPMKRLEGTDSLANLYKKETPGQ